MLQVSYSFASSTLRLKAMGAGESGYWLEISGVRVTKCAFTKSQSETNGLITLPHVLCGLHCLHYEAVETDDEKLWTAVLH